MKTAEGQWIPIGKAVARLAIAIGRDHAIGTLLMALQRGELGGVAPIFNAHGRGLVAIRGRDTVRLPSTARDYVLPPEFWMDGFGRPNDLAFWADWEQGNFSWQDRFSPTSPPMGRSATGVLVAAAQAVQVLQTYLPDVSMEALCGAGQPEAVKPVGRPRGKGMYSEDPALFREGAALVASGAAPNKTAAARRLIEKARGASEDAILRRLAAGIGRAMEIN